jgi:hypothetical protein
MRSFSVVIKGESPYMQARLDAAKLEKSEKKRGKLIEREDARLTNEQRAEELCYRNKDGKCYIPSTQLYGVLINAGSHFKTKVGASSKSLKTLVAGMISISPFEIIMPDYDEVDAQPGSNRFAGKIMLYRPKWSTWKAEFTLHVNNDSITDETLIDLLTVGGSNYGIGAYRPQKSGPYGRFKLSSFKEIKN